MIHKVTCRHFAVTMIPITILPPKECLVTEIPYAPERGYILDVSLVPKWNRFSFEFTDIDQRDKVLIIPVVMRSAQHYGLVGQYFNGIGTVVMGTARKGEDTLFELRSWNSGMTFSCRKKERSL